MFKNVASQIVAAQLVSTTDGSAVTSGTTNVYVTLDGGTQGAGGNTTATHEGNGTWTYVTTAGDTNGDHVVLTFVNTSAVSVAVQAYTQDKFAADALTRSAGTMAYGTASGGSSTTVTTSSFTLYGGGTIGTNDLAGRRVYFRGDATTARANGARITSNTSGATPTLTIDAADAFTATPTSGSFFVVA